MSENKKKEAQMQRPVEQHYTASWANTRKNKSASNVWIADETSVINAKEYVDENEK